PHDLETVCLKCLEKEPRKRYASAQDLADDLCRFLDGEPVLARSVGRLERTWRWCRRRPAQAALLALTLLVALVGFPGATWLWWEASAARDDARRHEGQAREAEADALRARKATGRQAAPLLLDRGLDLARKGGGAG